MNLQLRKYRRLAGLNQQQTADALNVKVATYRTWENGRRNMSFPQAIECAELFGCTTDELAGREPVRTFADPMQAALNAYYESMNGKGRETLVDSARLMSGSPDTRLEIDRPEHLPVQAEMERIA